LDINAGIPGADEPALLKDAVQAVMDVVDVPLCIDTANPDALASALEAYPGKALINSTTAEESMMERVFPLANQFGAAVIGVITDEGGIPATSEERLEVARRLVTRAGDYGIPAEDIIIDPLALTVGADHNAGRVTLETVEKVVREFGVNITMGASNISFGLPDRKYVNATFIGIAIHAGLTCPITNPLVTEVNTAVLGADLSLGKDEFGMRWIKAYRKRRKASQS
jgi:5-methyltetrahydrofolate--homocysteine methyltransferase